MERDLLRHQVRVRLCHLFRRKRLFLYLRRRIRRTREVVMCVMK